MKHLKILILVINFLLNFNLAHASDFDLRVEQITKNLRCLICQGQSVFDSDSDFANSLKIVVKKKINDGLTEKQIYAHLKDKYGEWILYDPKFGKNTYFLWLLPIFLFLIGGVIILKLFIIKKN